MNDILYNEVTITYNNTIYPADPYELARINDIMVFPDWIRSQLLTFAVILIGINLLFMVFHKQIASLGERAGVSRTLIYDLVFGVNLSFALMMFYVVVRS